jgi:putative hydrolase of the HAD superfamily
MNQYRVIILDVNGTLLGYEDPLGFEKRFASACNDLGESVTTDQVRNALSALVREWAHVKERGIRRASSGEQYRRTMTRGYQLMLEALGLKGDLWQKADTLYERFIVREGFMPPFRDARPALERLKEKGYRLGVLSNFPPHLEETLEKYGLLRYFDFLVVSSLVGLEKPDPLIFRLAIEKAGCPLGQILYVGDDLHDDIRGAQAVGLRAVLIDRHGRWPEADCVKISSLSELLEPDLLEGQAF